VDALHLVGREKVNPAASAKNVEAQFLGDALDARSVAENLLGGVCGCVKNTPTILMWGETWACG